MARCVGRKRFVVVFLLLSMIGGCRFPGHWSALFFGSTAGGAVRFVYKDAEATTVAVAGDFNEWSSKANMLKQSGDVWSLDLALPPGRYEYQFVIDDRRRAPDPEAVIQEDDGFGSKNSVVILE